MKILPKIYTLKEEAQAELYELFDKSIRHLEKKSDGTIDPFAKGLINNDVDAMRHSPSASKRPNHQQLRDRYDTLFQPS